MKTSNSHYKLLDIFRAVMCIAVLLYHTKLLPGGFLAVCGFFVLSGFLSTQSLLNKTQQCNKFYSIDEGYNRKSYKLKSVLKQYYTSRFKRIYLPLVCVTFITLVIYSFIKDAVWVSLKPETTSVIFGYNNLWQIGANADYFAKHVDSPFMHLWYIAILLQFDLVFPLIFFTIKKIDKKDGKISLIISSLLFIGFSVYFVYFSYTKDMMPVYYGTFTRLFSLLAGVMCGYICHVKGNWQIFKTETNGKIAFYLSLFILSVLFIKTDSSNINYGIIMLFVTVLSALMILAATLVNDIKDNKVTKAIKLISDISYSVYLVQYPMIYFFQLFFYNEEKTNFEVVLIIVASFVVGWLIYWLFNFRNEKMLRKGLLIMMAFASVCGCFEYLITEDHTEEMRLLQQQLAENDELLQQFNEEYQQNLLEQQQQWDSIMEQLQTDSDNLQFLVKNVTVTAIGDSVMLGASQSLRNIFPNCYCDAKVSRTFYVGANIAAELQKKNMLGNVVVIHLGTNGNVPDKIKRSMIESCAGKDVFMLNCTNDRDVHVNSSIQQYCDEYDYVHLIDWVSLSKPHGEWFYGDGIHLNSAGRKGYAQIVYDAVYQLYNERLQFQKQQAIAEHERQQKKRISFYGNDLLTSAVAQLQQIYPTASFNNPEDWQSLMDEILIQKQQGSLSHNIVFIYDKTAGFTHQQYRLLMEQLKENNVIIVKLSDKDNIELTYGDNVKVIDLSEQINKDTGLLLPDKIHLSQKGNNIMVETLTAFLPVVNEIK